MLLSHHHVMFAADGALPEWLHLLPAGTFSGVDGRGPFRLKDAAAVVAASMAGGPLPIDENHATDYAVATGQPSPARGWIRDLDVREDGIWGRVEWTPTGQQLMSERAYRGISPVFTHDKSGTVLQLLRAALTNTPNLTQLATLHHQQDAQMDPTKFRAALGLPETADEAAILAAVTAAATAVSAHATQISAIAVAAGVNATTADGLVTALASKQTAAGDIERMTAQIVGLQTEVQTLRASRGAELATAFVDAAIRNHKPIAPLREHFIARHMLDAAGVEKEINALPSINDGGIVRHMGGDGGADPDQLTPVEMDVVQRMGLDPKEFAKTKRAQKTAARDGGMT